ncbi:DUF5518 domain-containing protein [Salinirubellus sp. GCM10025818]|uniref:DUF5518 domain-containing protein n=1 Tax=Salinirubellus TaxID=2162630 RepID=UPI0030D1EF25
MSELLRSDIVPSAWRFAIIGALVSLPVTVLVNWLPDSEADIAGGIMIFGAVIAGVIAAKRSTSPGAAGLRAGVLGGITAPLTTVVTVEGPSIATLMAWPSPYSLVILAAVSLVLASRVGSSIHVKKGRNG